MSQKIRVAVIDLYNGDPNQGMRCIREILEECDGRWDGVEVEYETYDARADSRVPGLEYDAYISTGGPGSPFDGVGKPWEELYFNWLRTVWKHNERYEEDRRHIFFI